MDIQKSIDRLDIEIEELKTKIDEEHMLCQDITDLEELIDKAIMFGDLCAKRDAKAQAVPECTWSRNEDYYFDTSCGNNFMFTECEDKPSEHQFKHCCYCGGKLIEAQEQKITLLKVEWASDCFECGHHEAIIYSTASEASAKGWFHDGDAVKCCKCGHTGYLMSSEEAELAYEVFNDYIMRNELKGVDVKLPFELCLGEVS